MFQFVASAWSTSKNIAILFFVFISTLHFSFIIYISLMLILFLNSSIHPSFQCFLFVCLFIPPFVNPLYTKMHSSCAYVIVLPFPCSLLLPMCSFIANMSITVLDYINHIPRKYLCTCNNFLDKLSPKPNFLIIGNYCVFFNSFICFALNLTIPRPKCTFLTCKY